MEENKKGMSPILIVVLTIIGICLVGFCTWYGVNYFKGEEKSVEEQSSVIEQQEPTNNDIGEKIDFPQKSDEVALINGFFEMLTAKEVRTNFRNLKKEKNGNTFIYNCEEYDNEGKICQSFALKINNEITLNYGVDAWEKDTVNDETLLDEYLKKVWVSTVYKVNDYYVVIDNEDLGGGWDLLGIRIFNKSKQVYENNRVSQEYWLDESNTVYGTGFKTYPVIVNEKLHFISSDDNEYGKVKYNIIDLTKDKIEVEVLKTFNGYIEAEL